MSTLKEEDIKLNIPSSEKRTENEEEEDEKEEDEEIQNKNNTINTNTYSNINTTVTINNPPLKINHLKELEKGNFMPSILLLDQKKINVNDEINPEGDCLIHYACKFCFFNVFRTLIEIFNADINKQNKFGLTPFHILCKKLQENYFLVSYILKLDGLKYDLIDNNGRSPIFYAIEYDYVDVFYNLCYYKVNLNQKDNDGNGLIYYALKYDNLISLKFLLFHSGMKLKNEIKNLSDILITNNGSKCCKYLLKYHHNEIEFNNNKKLSLKKYTKYNLFNYDFIKTVSIYYNNNFIIALFYILFKSNYRIYNLSYLIKFHFLNKFSPHFKRLLITIYSITMCLIFTFLYFKLNKVPFKLNFSLLIHLYQLSTILFILYSVYYLFYNKTPEKIKNFYTKNKYNYNDLGTQTDTVLFHTQQAFERNIFNLCEKGESCPICLIKKSKSTVHCNVCNKCVNNFYFHSKFLDLCINDENVGYYITLILCVWFIHFSLIAQIKQIITVDYYNDNKDEQYFFAMIYYFFGEASLLLILVVLFLLISGILLFGFNMDLLICKGAQTTYYLMFNTHKIPSGKIMKRKEKYCNIPKINTVNFGTFIKNFFCPCKRKIKD